MNSLTVLTFLAAFAWGYFTGEYSKRFVKPRDYEREGLRLRQDRF